MKPVASVSKWIWVVAGIVLLLAIGIGLGFKRQPYDTWSEDVAKVNLNKHGNLYALSQYYQQQFPNLKQQVWRTWNTKEPQFTDQSQHLLFIQNNTALTETQFQQLLQWVAQGNHVVMTVQQTDPNDVSDAQDDESDTALPPDWEEADKEESLANVAAWAGITFKQRDWSKQPAPAQASCKPLVERIIAAHQRVDAQAQISPKTQEQWEQECAQNISTITLPEGKHLTWLNSEQDAAGFGVKPSKRVLWQSQGVVGSHIVRIQHGSGTMTLVNSMSAFGNPIDPRSVGSDLSRADHAYLASYLAQGKQMVWFINKVGTGVGTEQPLWKKLWQFSPVFCVSLLLLFCLFVWRSAYRLGITKSRNNHDNRQLQQYLSAQGEFLWQHQNHQQILSQLQQQLWQEWQKRIPGLSTLPRDKQLAAIAQINSASTADIQLWLQAVPANPTTKLWLAYLQAHQHIRNAK